MKTNALTYQYDGRLLWQKFRETPKLVYSTIKCNAPLYLSVSTLEIKRQICGGLKCPPYSTPGLALAIRHEMCGVCNNDENKLKEVRKCGEMITDHLKRELQQLTWLIINLIAYQNDDIPLKLDDIEEIYLLDNPDVILKLKDNRVVYIELTQVPFNESEGKIHKNVRRHTKSSKIVGSCRKRIPGIIDTDDCKLIYLVFFSTIDLKDKTIHYSNFAPKEIRDNIEKYVNECWKISFPQIDEGLRNTWKFFYRIY